ncbi:uncharacterized protein CDAR_274971 [Caerostris darwini]|uniref:Sushi domain-containing protein n=1 Tax=Caerostris darwini TaxID=1538125 RepID=A0AAV4UEQ9_9ARAC|nr:uncharacterized protein CDAR_274971 [Caerostris darwini]
MLSFTFFLCASAIIASEGRRLASGHGDLVVRPKVQSFALSFEDSALEDPDDVLLTRIARSSQRCRIPSHHKDSEIVCKTFPSRMECVQTCVYGYTLDAGVSKTYECRDGEWSPNEPFEKCKPYEDMTVALGPGGKIKCWSNFLDQGPICEIECSPYEDKTAVQKRLYRYYAKEEWRPELPFCAKAGTGISLVAPPRNAVDGSDDSNFIDNDYD